MSLQITRSDTRRKLFAVFFACGMAVAMMPAESASREDQHAAAPAPQKHSPYRSTAMPDSARRFYKVAWGIDQLQVQRTASNNLIRFNYRVNDPERAKRLGDKQAKPHLIDPRRGVMLEVPVMDKIGQLRQAGTLQAGKEYWMVFSNKGNLVKAGDRVNVVIGAFHADGLVVE